MAPDRKESQKLKTAGSYISAAQQIT